VNCIIFLLLYTLNALKFQLDVQLYNLPIICQLFIVAYFVPQYLTQLLVLAFSVDRYIVVCHPLRRAELCRPSRSIKVTRLFLCSVRDYFVTQCKTFMSISCLYLRNSIGTFICMFRFCFSTISAALLSVYLSRNVTRLRCAKTAKGIEVLL